MRYQHKNTQQALIDLPVGKVVCIGRNYAKHAKELGNEIPEAPLFFMKPKNALCELENPFSIPHDKGEVHYETEIAVLLQTPLKNANKAQVEKAIWGYGIAFDLTLRELQNQLKKSGQPWEKAKAFDGACPVSRFIEKEIFANNFLYLSCHINHQPVQFADTRNMLWSITDLMIEMSRCFTLEAGDIILTGTPEGVGALKQGDQLSFSLGELVQNKSKPSEVKKVEHLAFSSLVVA